MRQKAQRNKYSKKANLTQEAKAKIRRDILEYIACEGSRGATAEEISDNLEIRYATASARCSELKRDGLIKTVGARVTSSGRYAAILFLNIKL